MKGVRKRKKEIDLNRVLVPIQIEKKYMLVWFHSTVLKDMRGDIIYKDTARTIPNRKWIYVGLMWVRKSKRERGI